MSINQYQFLDEIGEHQGFIYRIAKLKNSEEIVLLKWSRSINAENDAALQHEYQLLHNKQYTNILIPNKLIKWGIQLALVFPLSDPHYCFLDTYLVKKPLALPSCLQHSIALVQALDSLYNDTIRHKNLHPNAILVHKNTAKLHLTAFQFCSNLSCEENNHPPENEMPFSYISPEQTGRINRKMDYRSDLYSLGIIFYQMLTGHLPFIASDRLEICYQHIAQTAHFSVSEREKIPLVLIEITLKLLHKESENRYQNLNCLHSDLLFCQQQYLQLGDIPSFTLAQADISKQLVIPERLYGRKKELQQLKTAFEAVQTGQSKQQWFLVSGDAGVGKTMLVQELQQTVAASHGYFISGKFDQFQRHKPYHALLDAFKALFRQILTEDKNRIAIWQQRIQTNLETNQAVLLDVLPELAHFINHNFIKTETLEEVSSQRFQNSIHQLMLALCTDKQPLVLFFDDLQWIDTASFTLIEQLLVKLQVSGLFMISAYRTKELAIHSPARLILHHLQQSDIQLTQLELQPLDKVNLGNLIADSLQKSGHEVHTLMELIYAKTLANPFYIKAFLCSLYEAKVIYFSNLHQQWQWTETEIANFPSSDNVVALMRSQLKKLPEHNRNLLTLAACIGNKFQLDFLATVADDKLSHIQESLFLLLQKNLLVQTGISYRFNHDRIQEAAYHLLSYEQRAVLHQKIGTLLLNNTQKNVFEIANHLNRSTQLHCAEVTGETLANINYMAGNKAKSSTAYRSAKGYFQAGINALKSQWGMDDIWLKHNYILCFNLHLNLAKMHYLCLEFDQAESLYRLLNNKNRTDFDQIRINALRCAQYTHQTEWLKALKQGLSSLHLFKIDIPDDIDSSQLSTYWSEIKADIYLLLNDSKVASSLTESQQLIIHVFRNLVSPLYLMKPRLLLFISFKIILLFKREQGLFNAPIPLVVCGLLLGELLEEYKVAYQLAQYGYSLAKETQHNESRGMILANSILSSHWCKPLRLDFPILRESYKHLINEGDLIYATYSVGILTMEQISQGIPLHKIKKEMKIYRKFLSTMDNQIIDITNIQKSYIRNLSKKITSTDINKNKFISNDFNEKLLINKLTKTKSYSAITCFNVYYLQLAIFFDERALARNLVRVSATSIHYLTGHITVLEHHFFSALALLRTNIHSKKFTLHYHKLSLYADNCEENFLAAKQLLDAEYARLSGDFSKAIDFYDHAIANAKKNGFIHYQALANEYAAQFWLSRNKNKIALSYLDSAYQAYKQWGATRKLQHMRVIYPEFALQLQYKVPPQVKVKSNLDIKTVIDSAQAIISQVNLNALIRTILSLVMENAGADRAVLLLGKSDTLHVKASAYLDAQGIHFDTVTATPYPARIINYVSNSYKTIIINQLKSENEFLYDDYFESSKVKSLLCCPLLEQDKFSGVLYLENALLTDAFHQGRKQLVKVIASYAAIAVNKANLYYALSQEISGRKKSQQKLQQALVEIQHIKQRLEAENEYLYKNAKVTHNFSNIIGHSAAIYHVLEQIELVAPTNANVCIMGESGTGKELVAQAIHARSQRQYQPLIKVNCSAIPKDLFESEFFGHIKGAFTGAVKTRIGRFELADGGTLFLDEVGEIPLDLQSKLLRVLQEGEFERIGDDKTQKVDVRIITATNRNLEKAILRGNFRQDLFFRLNVFPISIPPLRERKEDIPLLAKHFMESLAPRMNKFNMILTQGDMKKLQNYHWQGNVRELQNIIERAMIIGDDKRLKIELNTPIQYFSDSEKRSNSAIKAKVLTEDEIKQHYRNNIISALQQSKGRVSGKEGAAILLGLKPTTLSSKIKSLKISRKELLICKE